MDKKHFFIFFLIFFLFISRFYSITWGAPYFFHPDERNIASSIAQLSFPFQINPHFFAYGSIPIYTIYFFGILDNIIFHTMPFMTVSFDKAIIIGRILSAIFSLLLIYLLYNMGKLLFSHYAGILAVILGITSIGLIQYAHFATFEMWLTFFSFLLTYFCIMYVKNPSKKILFSITLILGILIGIKISSLVLFFPVFLSLFLCPNENNEKKSVYFLKSLLLCCFVSFFSIVLYILSNPFVFLDTDSFLSSMQYESSVGLGTLHVFYTQGFINTIPIVYQFLKIFPFILTPFLTIFFIPSFLYVCYLAIKTKNKLLIIFLTFFLILFLSQTLLFVKWTRYVIPTLPYIYVILGYIFSKIVQFRSTSHFFHVIAKFFVWSLLSLSFLYAIFFIYEVYKKEDTRLQAKAFAERSISKNSAVVSEVYDLGIVPFNPSFPNITLVNFYDLETNPDSINTATQDLSHAEYIILPSQRIVKNRILYPTIFPKGNSFYKQFFDPTKYKKIYQTPCDIFCEFIYNGDPVFNLEETTTVFDRPTIFIFKKL